MEVYGLIEVGPHCKYPNGLKQADIIPPARIKFKRGLYYAQRLIEMYSAKIQVKLYEEEENAGGGGQGKDRNEEEEKEEKRREG